MLPQSHSISMHRAVRIAKGFAVVWLLILFVGTALLCALIAIRSAVQPENPGSLLLFAGALSYLIGPFGITVLFNVPLNNKLAATDIADANEIWPLYQKQWQGSNHVRSCIGLGSVVLLAAGLGAYSAC